MMKPPLHVCADAEALGQETAKRLLEAVIHKPDLLWCAAGGSTPQRAYELLAKSAATQLDRFRSLRLVKLDEWGGLAMDDPGTCEYQVRTSVGVPLGVTTERYLGFDSNPADPIAECSRIRQRLAAEGPIDLCLLGLGLNGHIGMNEPAPFLEAEAHIASLAESTLRHPMLAHARSQPAYGLTLGLAEILGSREILLLVSGAKKREPLRRLLRHEITTEFPASFLWLHPNWTLLCDRVAAEGLDLPP